MSDLPPRTPTEDGWFKTLKRALLGSGEALAKLFAFGSQAEILVGADYPTISTAGVWVPVDEFDVQIQHPGVYWVDLLVFFTGNSVAVDYQCRILVNGVPTGDVLSKELKDADDSVEYNTFNRYALPKGPLNIVLEARINGGGGATMAVTRFRLRFWRVS
jgi:hypothetical protein